MRPNHALFDLFIRFAIFSLVLSHPLRSLSFQSMPLLMHIRPLERSEVHDPRRSRRDITRIDQFSWIKGDSKMVYAM